MDEIDTLWHAVAFPVLPIPRSPSPTRHKEPADQSARSVEDQEGLRGRVRDSETGVGPDRVRDSDEPGREDLQGSVSNACGQRGPSVDLDLVHRARNGREKLLPAIISIQKGINGIHDPRYPSLKGIMAAKKKTIDISDAPTVEPRLEVIRMEMPPDRPAGKIVGTGVEAVPELVRLLKEEAKVL